MTNLKEKYSATLIGCGIGDILGMPVESFSKEQIQYYIDNYRPLDKAGSYGIKDWFAVCVKKINGCYFNVMGFPLSKFYKHYLKFLEEMK